MTHHESRKITQDLGLEVSSSHASWANPSNLAEVEETAGSPGVDTACRGYGLP